MSTHMSTLITDNRSPKCQSVNNLDLLHFVFGSVAPPPPQSPNYYISTISASSLPVSTELLLQTFQTSQMSDVTKPKMPPYHPTTL